MSLNMGMLASYDQSVELFRDSLGFGDVSTVLDWKCLLHFGGSHLTAPTIEEAEAMSQEQRVGDEWPSPAWNSRRIASIPDDWGNAGVDCVQPYHGSP
ncbi:hypothetical protein MUK42_14753 [Musa troglodytarum]|uniref:Uncharacterized protein n=1 Tax=Musa troglodytarum TaxID=320322 RepID=A0A9E7KAH6_9LILI|nr:hypothetical protein MUK42_14753 [Musa troglodytarum]